MSDCVEGSWEDWGYVRGDWESVEALQGKQKLVGKQWLQESR